MGKCISDSVELIVSMTQYQNDSDVHKVQQPSASTVQTFSDLNDLVSQWFSCAIMQ